MITPDQRMALIEAEEEQDTRGEPAPLPEQFDPGGLDWCGVWVDCAAAEECVTEAFRTVYEAVKRCRESTGVVDVGCVTALAVANLEKLLAKACANEELGLAAARLGTLAIVEGAPVDLSPMGVHLKSNLQ